MASTASTSSRTKKASTLTDKDDVDEIKMKKRLYIRKKMQFYRSEEKNEMLALKKKTFELENDVIRLTRPNQFRLRINPVAANIEPEALPWKEVAIALREDRDEKTLQTRSLKHKVDERAFVVECMRRWVDSATAMQHSLNPAAKSWRNVSLLAHPEARAMGKDWITKQLYHNTNDMFRHYGFPNGSNDDNFVMNEILFNEACFDTISARQVIVNMPFEALQKALHGRNMWILMMDNVLGATELDVDSRKPGDLIHHHAMSVIDEHANLLSREFPEEDRCVFVGQQIHEDETVPTQAIQRNRRFWVELQRVGPNQTRMRNIYLISQCFTRRGYLPLPVEARNWGCDLSTTPEHQMEDRFKRHATQLAWRQYNAGLKKLQQSVFSFMV
ncbi:unnamed protein product [Aphanomyces euteiches]